MAFHLISADIMKLIRDPDTNCKTLNPIRMQHLGSSAEPFLPTSWLSRLGTKHIRGEYSIGKRVLARYPDTKCFSPATIKGSLKGSRLFFKGRRGPRRRG